MSDVEIEPIPGLPEELPEGEHIVWQGRPRWRTLALEAFHVRGVGLYFAGLIGVRALIAFVEAEPVGEALASIGVAVGLSLVALGLLYLLAWLNAKATMYTITNRRVVMRIGVAFPITFNLPFRRLGAADLKAYPNGDGEIALSLAGSARLAYLHLWPHARPWRFSPTSPMLRAIPDAARVANVLATAARGQA